jgi:hypothetical protein
MTALQCCGALQKHCASALQRAVALQRVAIPVSSTTSKFNSFKKDMQTNPVII